MHKCQNCDTEFHNPEDLQKVKGYMVCYDCEVKAYLPWYERGGQISA